jgi:type VI secretion system protein ImpK
MSNNTTTADAPSAHSSNAQWDETQGEVLPKLPLPREPSRQARLEKMQKSKNPLLEAAQRLLRALADMPPALDEQQIDLFHRLLQQEVTSFNALCNKANIRHEHVIAASFCLCTAIDEAANSTAWGGAKNGKLGVWANLSLAREFHSDTHGGDKFFLLAGRLSANHVEHIDLIEVMFMILGLGFEGRYHSEPNGRLTLDKIRHRLFEMVESVRGPAPAELSPPWTGNSAGAVAFRTITDIPVWVSVLVLSLGVLALFFYYKYRLDQQVADVTQRIEALGQIRLPAAPVKLLRLKELLSAEIARGTVTVEEDDQRSAVSFKGDDMFVPGQARLNAKILPVLAKVADEINQVPGTVHVAGHSDNQPIRTREFPDNQALSEKRAAAVAEVLQGKGVVASRMRTEGRGDTAPIADNATAAGRARNRRVDIVVMLRGAAAPLSPAQAIAR